MASLKCIDQKKIEMGLDKQVVDAIAQAAGVAASEIIEARFHFEGSDPQRPQTGVPTLTVAVVKSLDLADAKTALNNRQPVNFFDISLDAIGDEITRP